MTPKCCDCGSQVSYIRHTQFAGDHYFCNGCAKKEPNFGVNDHYGDWEQKIFSVPSEHQPMSVGKLKALHES